MAGAVFTALSSIHFRLSLCDPQLDAFEHPIANRVVKCTLYPLTIAFLCSLRKETTAVPRHLEQYQRPDMDTSLKTINVMLSPDMLEPHTAISDSPDSDASPPTRRDRRREESPEAPRTARSRKTADRHVAFQGTRTQRQATIHPIFRERLGSGRAGNIGALDDWITRHGGTTSSYEELPHRLRISKKHQPMTPSERVIELTKTNGFLLQELAYHKDTRAAEMRFLEKATKLRADIEGALAAFDRALEERSKARVDAESILLDYWGIDLGDGNIEDSIF